MQKATLVIGFGLTGRSIAAFLHGKQKPMVLFDTRTNPPELSSLQTQYPDTAIYCQTLPETVLSQCGDVVVSPGVADSHPILVEARARELPIIGDIELFARVARAPIIAITGTNGKSTVTTLVARLLSDQGYVVAVGGNLGVPALSLQDDSVEYYVLELSSYQLDRTYSLRARVAVLLNISPDHLDRYASYQEYSAAKRRIFHGAQQLVYNGEDSATVPVDSSTPADYFSVKTDHQAIWSVIQTDLGESIAHNGQALLPVERLPNPTQPMVANTLAALAVGVQLQLDVPLMLQTITQFQGLAHRCQWLGVHLGIAWVNDSKATNIGAALQTIPAVAACSTGRLLLIAGGQGKGVSFCDLKPVIAAHVAQLIVMGEDGSRLVEECAGTIPVQYVDSMQAAVALSAQLARPGDTVLLAPACASFDMFDNFAARGDAFAKAVLEIDAHA